jgi:hypothetical protein
MQNIERVDSGSIGLINACLLISQSIGPAYQLTFGKSGRAVHHFRENELNVILLARTKIPLLAYRPPKWLTIYLA